MTKQNPLGLNDIAEIIAILKEGGWRSATLKLGDFELSVSDGDLAAAATPAAPVPVAAPAPASAPAPAAKAAPAPGGSSPVVEGDSLVVVKANTLGAFWRSPQPGAPAFVEIGDVVQPDTPLGIVEVMKMMTRITAGVSGKVKAIHVGDGDLVEQGQALVTIETD
ncbi:acetyl-CoA carboxylase biotin carboxyl carrier protein [Achromobacter aloeverae]